MDKIIYAIGDVHGRIDLLEQLYERIDEHHAFMHAGNLAELIHLGDYIDRGPKSVDVIDRLMRGGGRFSTTCLLGNHEAMMLECTKTDNRQAWYTWLSNGGDETLTSLGVSPRFGDCGPEDLKSALGNDRIKWLNTLPLYRVVEPYLFVHAGIAPGIPIDQQTPADLLWIRSRFLESQEDHGFVIIHGHTPGADPVVRPNRICIDTGAPMTGILTAAVIGGSDAPTFLRAVG